jgi:hypothetical protein
MKLTIDREIFHQMMRGIAGKNFGLDIMCEADRHRMFLLAERLAHATAAKTGGKVEVDVS